MRLLVSMVFCFVFIVQPKLGCDAAESHWQRQHVGWMECYNVPKIQTALVRNRRWNTMEACACDFSPLQTWRRRDKRPYRRYMPVTFIIASDCCPLHCVHANMRWQHRVYGVALVSEITGASAFNFVQRGHRQSCDYRRYMCMAHTHAHSAAAADCIRHSLRDLVGVFDADAQNSKSTIYYVGHIIAAKNVAYSLEWSFRKLF